MARQFVPTSRLEYADNNAFDAGSNFSLSLWVKFASTDNYGEIVRKDGNYILRTAGSDLDWIWWDGTGQLRGFIFPLPSLNLWHQLVITVNANVSEKVYLDGTDLGLSDGLSVAAPGLSRRRSSSEARPLVRRSTARPRRSGSTAAS